MPPKRKAGELAKIQSSTKEEPSKKPGRPSKAREFSDVTGASTSNVDPRAATALVKASQDNRSVDFGPVSDDYVPRRKMSRQKKGRHLIRSSLIGPTVLTMTVLDRVEILANVAGDCLLTLLTNGYPPRNRTDNAVDEGKRAWDGLYGEYCCTVLMTDLRQPSNSHTYSHLILLPSLSPRTFFRPSLQPPRPPSDRTL